MKKFNNKKIKIGIFVDGDFIPSYDGAANRFHYLSRNLQKIGIEVVIFHGYRRWSDLSLIKKEPFKTYIFPIQQYHKNLDLIASIIRKEKIEIIQFDNLEPIVLQGIRLSCLTNTYLVSEMHYVVRNLAKDLGATRLQVKTIEKLEKIVGKSVDHLICLSKNDKPHLIENMGISRNRVSVMPSGADVENIIFWGPNFKKKTIIFLGNLFFEPNLEALKIIHKYIYSKLKKFNFRFLIVGDCPKKIQNRYQSSDFKFTGTVEDLNHIFKKSTIALAPILKGTGLRIKIINYLAAGIPTIATKAAISGFSNKNGFIIENDFKKYPQIILGLINKQNDALRLSENGKAIIDKNFDWRIIAKRTKSIYQKILQSPLKSKNQFITKIPAFKRKEPVWLEEAKRKGRFAKQYFAFKNNFLYAIIEDGKMRVFNS